MIISLVNRFIEAFNCVSSPSNHQRDRQTDRQTDGIKPSYIALNCRSFAFVFKKHPALWGSKLQKGTKHMISTCVRFQVLTAASMMFRAVFWVVLPCKMIVDRRFRGAYCFKG